MIESISEEIFDNTLNSCKIGKKLNTMETIPVKHYLVLAEHSIVTMTAPVKYLPKKLDPLLDDDHSDRKELQEARFYRFGVAFICLEILNETIIGQLEGDDKHREKFLEAFVGQSEKDKFSFKKLTPTEVEEFKTKHPGVFVDLFFSVNRP